MPALLFGSDAGSTEPIVSEEEIYKALPLSLSSWLEVSDPKHRYGPSLLLLYNGNGFTNVPEFLNFLSKQEDHGLPKVKYLTQEALANFCCVFSSEGSLKWQKTSNPLEAGRYIFVMTTAGRFYCGKKEKSVEPWFLHSSLGFNLKVAGAGKFVVDEAGSIVRILNSSGHYCPPDYGMHQVLCELNRHLKLWDSLVIVLLKSEPLEPENWQAYKALTWFNSRPRTHEQL